MDVKKLRQLMQLMERYHIAEIRLEGEEGTLHLKRDTPNTAAGPAR